MASGAQSAATALIIAMLELPVASLDLGLLLLFLPLFIIRNKHLSIIIIHCWQAEQIS